MIRADKMDADRRDGGFVLVNTLVIILALSFLAIKLLQDVSQGTEHLAAMQANEQAELISDAGVAFAADLLAKDAKSNAFDYRGEAWALSDFSANADKSVVRVSVSDLESRFNLNLLVSGTPQVPLAILTKLVESTGAAQELVIEIPISYAPFQPSGSQVLEASTEQFVAGDLTHHGQFASIAGLAASEAGNLRDNLSVLPRSRGVNVNTATPYVLAALTGLEPGPIDVILALRKNSPFESVEKFTEAVAAVAGSEALAKIPTELLSVSSAWFLLETSVTIDQFRHRAETIVYRDPRTGEISVFARESERTG